MMSSKNGTQLLELYDRLLEAYWNILNKAEVNPYESIGKQFVHSLQPRYWRYHYRSGRQFLKNPNTLKQELVGGRELLEEMKDLTDNEIESLATMNEVNLERLRRRDIATRLVYQLEGKSLVLKGTSLAVAIYFGIEYSLENPLANDEAVFVVAYVLFLIVLSFFAKLPYSSASDRICASIWRHSQG